MTSQHPELSGSEQAVLVREELTGAAIPPCSVWRPAKAAPRAIVLVGHGGSQDRNGLFVAMMARDVIERIPAYVVAIDGPLHGDRRRGDASETREAFVGLWRSPGGGVNGMTADWLATLSEVRKLEGADTLPTGYYGVSMGTAYGIPLLAANPAICVAALGMWSDAAAGMDHLIDIAPRVRCPVQFVHREEDQFFEEAAARRLFDLLGSSEKTFVALPGPHQETPDQIADAASYLAKHLASAGLATGQSR